MPPSAASNYPPTNQLIPLSAPFWLLVLLISPFVIFILTFAHLWLMHVLRCRAQRLATLPVVETMIPLSPIDKRPLRVLEVDPVPETAERAAMPSVMGRSGAENGVVEVNDGRRGEGLGRRETSASQSSSASKASTLVGSEREFSSSNRMGGLYTVSLEEVEDLRERGHGRAWMG